MNKVIYTESKGSYPLMTVNGLYIVKYFANEKLEEEIMLYFDSLRVFISLTSELSYPIELTVSYRPFYGELVITSER